MVADLWPETYFVRVADSLDFASDRKHHIKA